MRYCYTSDFSDFKKAQACYWSSSTLRRLRFHFYRWGLFAIGLVLMAICIPLRANSLPNLIMMPAAVGCMAGGAVSALLWPWQIRRGYRALGGDFRKAKRVYIEISEGMLISGVEGTSEGRFQRSAICEVVEGDGFFLLFAAPKRFIFLSKKYLPGEAVNEIHEWLRLLVEDHAC